MKSKIDVLLLARPDHSYTIYKGLLKSTLSFIYCSFKLLPSENTYNYRTSAILFEATTDAIDFV